MAASGRDDDTTLAFLAGCAGEVCAGLLDGLAKGALHGLLGEFGQLFDGEVQIFEQHADPCRSFFDLGSVDGHRGRIAGTWLISALTCTLSAMGHVFPCTTERDSR